MNRNDYVARVGDIAKRQEAERLFLAAQDAETAAEDAESAGSDEIAQRYDGLFRDARDAFEKRRQELVEERDKELIALAPTNVSDLRAAADAAQKAWADYPGVGLLTSEDDDGCDVVVRCAVSGLLIFEDDPVLEDEETGEIVLKACLGVPLDADNGEFIAETVAEAAE